MELFSIFNGMKEHTSLDFRTDYDRMPAFHELWRKFQQSSFHDIPHGFHVNGIMAELVEISGLFFPH